MHPAVRSVLVIAVVAGVVAAPVAGIATSAVAVSTVTSTDAVDRPAEDGLSGAEEDGSSDWPLLLLDHDDEEDEDEERDDDEEEEDEEDEDEREDEREEAAEVEDDDGEDEEEDATERDDDRTDGSDDSAESSDGTTHGDTANQEEPSKQEQPSNDEETANDQQGGDDQQSSTSSDESQSGGDRTADDEGADDDSSESRNVRVDAQEDDARQEDDDSEGNATENETRDAPTGPAPDIGRANVTVLQTPVVVGQPLVVEATTSNEGTEAGRKVIQFEVEHEIVDQRNFTLRPGESRTVTFRHVFETPGNKTFEVDSGQNRFVTVDERRPNLAVSAVEVAPESVEPGEDVTITASVRNDGYANGSLPVALELFGEVVAVKDVTLATNESGTVTFTRTLYEPGTYEAVVANETAEFRVVSDQSNDTVTTTGSVLESAAETPGFGTVAALAGVLVAVALALGRRE